MAEKPTIRRTGPLAAALVATMGLGSGCGSSHHISFRVPDPKPPATAADPTTASTMARVPPSTTSVPPATSPPPRTSSPATTTARVLPATTAAPTTSPHAAIAATTACPANLASSLASTGSGRQLITVEAADYSAVTASVELWQRDGSCWESAGGPWSGYIGHSGLSDHRTEGDGTTPTGLYGIGSTMYGNAGNPGVREAYHQLVCGDWWDEDPSSPEYNTFQHIGCGTTPPFAARSEALWTEAAAYPSFAVIDYNTDPVVPGAGSGIFLHASVGGGTDGCVSLPLAELDQALRWISAADAPAIAIGSAGGIAQL